MITALSFALVASVQAAAPVDTATTSTGVSVTFIANEGVMLAAGPKKVLIDALFLKYETGYAIAADSTQSALHSARAPFDGIALALVTHHHGDHFHPAPMVAHLRASPTTRLLAAANVVDSMRGRISASPTVLSRISAITVPPGSRRRETINGVAVEMLGLKHHDIDHHGYLMEIGGRRVLHLGDIDDPLKSLPTFRLDTMRIDVALLPAWMGMNANGREAIEKWIKPRNIAFIHVGISDRDRRQAEDRLRGPFPAATVFWRSLETKRW
jgi:L-ascorbate metabolism protein UlaG (beta-lactamase superfamily)